MAIIHRDTDYAFRALARLARTGEVVPVSALAAQEGVPEDFLRKIMQRLRESELVQSVQGPFGGYELARSPSEITVLDVVQSVQGPLVFSTCFEDATICPNVRVCALRHKLAGLQREMNEWLAGISLQDVQEERAPVPEAPDGGKTSGKDTAELQGAKGNGG